MFEKATPVSKPRKIPPIRHHNEGLEKRYSSAQDFFSEGLVNSVKKRRFGLLIYK
jgi:hypothetical protein